VIYIADVDLAHDQFFEFYRNADNRFSQDELRFLQDLRNVQFLSNAVDALAGDESFLRLRSRRAQRRPLERLDQVLAGTQKELRDVESAAQKDADAKIARLRDDIQQRLNHIRDRKDLDDQAREQLVAQVERSANRQLDKDIQDVNHEADLKTRKAQIEQQRQFEHVLNYGVRAKALGFPAVVLAALAMTVFAVRLRGERLDIPESRRRRHR
jgi:ABC-2 type transport system permease protein